MDEPVGYLNDRVVLKGLNVPVLAFGSVLKGLNVPVLAFVGFWLLGSEGVKCGCLGFCWLLSWLLNGSV